MPKAVLVVEDEVGVRRVLVRLLTECGFRTVEASNGREAIQRLMDETPAAIVIDLLMPVMSGLEFLKALRRNPFYRTIPTVVMTGALDPAVQEIAGVPTVHKPNIERLPEMLRALIQPNATPLPEPMDHQGSGEIGSVG